MIEIASQHFSIATQLSFNLNPKQQLSKLPKPDERPLFSGFYLIIVNIYRRIMIPNDSLNPAYPIIVAQVKPQPKDQICIILPFNLTIICSPKCTCFTRGMIRDSSTYKCLIQGLTRGSSTHTCLALGITRYCTTAKRLT